MSAPATRRLVHGSLRRLEGIRQTMSDVAALRRFRRTHEPHVHVVRERAFGVNWTFFEWLRERRPDAARLFRHSAVRMPYSDPIPGTALLVPWAQDPVAERSASLFRMFSEVEREHAVAGIDVVNPVASLSRSIKTTALRVLREAGFRVPRARSLVRGEDFDRVANDLGVPFIVREDQYHGGYVTLIKSADEFRSIQWSRLSHPIAVQFIDTRGNDGQYRKYRYIVLGDTGVYRHAVATEHWNVHAGKRVHDEAVQREEMRLVRQPNPFHADLVRARAALGFDTVAFDFSIDADGDLVIWEPNPFAILWHPDYDRDPFYRYQREWIDHVFDAILRFYLGRAKLSVD